MRFDDAIKSYGRLYELAYRKSALDDQGGGTAGAQGAEAEAVNALKTAIIGARTETEYADFAIAEHLESWHMLPDAVALPNAARNWRDEPFQETGRLSGDLRAHPDGAARRVDSRADPLSGRSREWT